MTGRMKKFRVSKELFLTQKDKTELIERIDNVKIELIERIEGAKTELNKSIFIAGVIQLLAIIGSLLAILSFMHK